MKRILSALTAAIALAILVPASTFAAAATTDVSGNVTLNGNPVKHAQVTITCGSKTKNTQTNKFGTYLVHFTAKNCPAGSTVSVSATGKGKSGSNTGTANPQTTKLNVALVDVSLVPEFGLITAAGASLIGGAAFMVVRRRHLSGQEA